MEIALCHTDTWCLGEKGLDWQALVSSYTASCQSVLIGWNQPTWQDDTSPERIILSKWPCWPGNTGRSKVSRYWYSLLHLSAIINHFHPGGEGNTGVSKFNLYLSFNIAFCVYSKATDSPNGILFDYTVFFFPAAHVLPLFSPHPSRLRLNATELSVTFTGYMWSAVPGYALESPLLLQCHLWFGAVWQRPLSRVLRISWVRLAWNSTVPDGRFQRPWGTREANDET